MAVPFQKGSGEWHEGILLFTRQLERIIVTGQHFFLLSLVMVLSHESCAMICLPHNQIF